MYPRNLWFPARMLSVTQRWMLQMSVAWDYAIVHLLNTNVIIFWGSHEAGSHNVNLELPFWLINICRSSAKGVKASMHLEGTKKEVWFTYTWGHSYHRYYCKRPPLHCQQFCMPCCLCLDHSASTVCTFKPVVVCHLYWIPVKCLLILYWLFTQGQQICSSRFVGGASQLGHILFRAPPFMLLIVPYIYLITWVSNNS